MPQPHQPFSDASTYNESTHGSAGKFKLPEIERAHTTLARRSEQEAKNTELTGSRARLYIPEQLAPMHLFTLCLAAAFFLHVGVFAPEANAAAPGTFVYAGCSPSRYAPNTAFESNLNSLLESISSASSSGATYNSFTAGSDAALGTEATAVNGAPSSSPAYGMYQCRGDLSAGECVSCVHDTVARLGSVCANAYAASLQSDGCYVRYDSSDFVGRADTSVAYRKCSSGTSDDAAFLKARDSVLAAELQGDGATVASPAAGYYKVSTSGDVQGVAQCLGDIAAADCPACLAQAVEQLKGTCGNAVAADVYLAKCSVRYWENGNYFRSSQGSCLQIQWHTIMNALIIITIRSSTFLEAETESFWLFRRDQRCFISY
jgi:hypothetical protein